MTITPRDRVLVAYAELVLAWREERRLGNQQVVSNLAFAILNIPKEYGITDLEVQQLINYHNERTAS